MKQYKAIVFDFDYTLADATAGILGSFQHSLRTHGYRVNDDLAIRRTVGMTLYDSFVQLTGETDETKVDALRKTFIAKADEIMTDGTVFLPYAKWVLEQAQALGIQTGIVTSKYRYRLEDFFARQGVVLDTIVGFEDVTSHKPDPEGLRLVMERLCVNKGDVLYVGDSVIDCRTAEAADVAFAGVVTGATTREELEACGYGAVYDDLQALWLAINA